LYGEVILSGEGSTVLLDAIHRFVALTGQIGVKGSDPQVRELMVTLRRAGFSSFQISELSGGK
jgi:hypothetical protein